MNIITHPGWCPKQHPAGPAHELQIGADLELTGELAYGVHLYQVGDDTPVVHLMRRTPDQTALTELSILQTSILRDLLGEGLEALAREVGR
jgi:hypothetical protein